MSRIKKIWRNYRSRLTEVRKRFAKDLKHFFVTYVKIRHISMVIGLGLISHFAYLILNILYPMTGEPSFQWVYFMLFGIFRAVIIIGIGYLVLSFYIPQVFRYIENKLFNEDIKKVTPWQRILFYILLYCFFIVVFLVSVITMSM